MNKKVTIFLSLLTLLATNQPINAGFGYYAGRVAQGATRTLYALPLTYSAFAAYVA